jgi:hypothetical protein
MLVIQHLERYSMPEHVSSSWDVLTVDLVRLILNYKGLDYKTEWVSSLRETLRRG